MAIVATKKGTANATGDAVIVRRSLSIHQAVAWLRHEFFLERVVTPLVIGDEKKKAKLGVKNVDVLFGS